MPTGQIEGHINLLTVYPKSTFTICTWWGAAILVEYDRKFLEDIGAAISMSPQPPVRITVDNDSHDQLGTARFILHSIEIDP